MEKLTRNHPSIVVESICNETLDKTAWGKEQYVLSRKEIEKFFDEENISYSLKQDYSSSEAVYYSDDDEAGLYIPTTTGLVATSDISEQVEGQKVKLTCVTEPEGAKPDYTWAITEGETLASIEGDELTCISAGTVKVVAKQGDTLTSNELTITITAAAVPDYALDFSGETAYTGMPTSAAVDTKAGSFTALSSDDWSQYRCYDNGKYMMLKTQSFVSGSDTSKEVAFISNAIALGGDVAKVEIDIMSGSSTAAVYQMKVAADAAITDMTDAQYSTSGDVAGKTVTFDVTQEGIKYIAIGATTAKNGQISAIRIFYK
mgnify:CR=1 FL=1